jgi:hypothetical protein
MSEETLQFVLPVLAALSAVALLTFFLNRRR